MSTKLPFFTNATGRFVTGDMDVKRTTDHNGDPKPENKWQYEFGIAFPKTEPDIARLFGEFNTFLQAEWAAKPRKIAALDTWFQTMQGLSMKIGDGDKPNKKGEYNANTAGCYVFYFSSSFMPKLSDAGFAEIPITSIKRGDWVRVAGTIACNGRDDGNAGIYMNFDHVQLVGIGDHIGGGMTAAEAFGGASQAALPPGAVAPSEAAGFTQPGMPPATAPMPGMQGTAPTVAGDPTQAAAPLPGQTPVATPTASPINPHTGILTGPASGAPASGAPASPMPGMPGV